TGLASSSAFSPKPRPNGLLFIIGRTMATGVDIGVFQRRRARLGAAKGGGGAVVATPPEGGRQRDAHFPYRFDSYFYYLTGFREPEAVLVIVAGEKQKSVLFCRERNLEREIWDGYRYGPEGARGLFGFDEAHPVAQLDELMPALLA